jgi:hypothetical protein
MRLAVTIAAALFLAVLIRAADWAATRVLWLCAALLVLGFAGLWLYHRRRLAELHELRAEAIGRWRRVGRFVPWPKACQDCGAVAHDWKSVRAHGDPARSACAAYTAHLERAEAEPGVSRETWSATVGRGAGAGSVDTLTEAGRPGLESEAS